MRNMMSMLQKAQAAKKQLTVLQKELSKARFTASDNKRQVSATVTGDGEVVGIDLSAVSDVTAANLAQLEKAIVQAISTAQSEASKAKNKRMKQAAADMGLPGGLGGL